MQRRGVGGVARLDGRLMRCLERGAGGFGKW